MTVRFSEAIGDHSTGVVRRPTSTMTRMPIAVTGHVDHDKSTVIGRLLADTGRCLTESSRPFA